MPGKSGGGVCDSPLTDWQVRNSRGGWRQLRESDLRHATTQVLLIRRQVDNDSDVEEEVSSPREQGVHGNRIRERDRGLGVILGTLREVMSWAKDPHSRASNNYVNCVAISLCEVINYLKDKEDEQSGTKASADGS